MLKSTFFEKEAKYKGPDYYDRVKNFFSPKKPHFFLAYYIALYSRWAELLCCFLFLRMMTSMARVSKPKRSFLNCKCVNCLFTLDIFCHFHGRWIICFTKKVTITYIFLNLNDIIYMTQMLIRGHEIPKHKWTHVLLVFRYILLIIIIEYHCICVFVCSFHDPFNLH